MRSGGMKFESQRSEASGSPMLVDNAVVQRLPPAFHFGTHMHRTVELLLCQEGCLDVTVQGKPLHIGAGMFIAVFPDIPHCADVPPDQACQILQTHFHSKGFSDLIASNGPLSEALFPVEVSVGRKAYCRGTYTHQMEACLCGLQAELAAPAKNTQEMVEAYLTQINVLLSRSLYRSTDAAVYENRYLVAALRYINDHYMEKLRVEDAAAYAGVSSRYLSKLFHDRLKIGIAEYLSSVRISHAISYKYTAPDYPLTALALDVGFSTPQHFSRVFKEKMGVSPKRYFSISRVEL